MRLPIIPGDENSPGNILLAFVENKISPGQTRLYCLPATPAQLQYFKANNFHQALFSPSQPAGKNTINGWFKAAGVLLGLEKPLCGHSLRRLAISKLVNGGVAVTEVMAVARHNSISATSVYMQRSSETLPTRLGALGITYNPV